MKHQIKEIIANADNKGALLEDITYLVLEDNNFFNINKQDSGTQFGFDLCANKKNTDTGKTESWKFECKNYSKKIKLQDIAPKLIWHTRNHANIDHFVIVSTTSLSNDLMELLETHTYSFDINVWASDTLINIIANSPKALERIGIVNGSYNQQYVLSGQLYERTSPITLFATHELNPPFSFHYLKCGNELTKAYSGYQFRYLISLKNTSEQTVDCLNFRVSTVDYVSNIDRVFVQHKAKGVFEPIEVKFSPTTTIGSAVSILENKLVKLNPYESEIFALTLGDNLIPGLYYLIISIDYILGDRKETVNSTVFPLHISNKNEDHLNLQVFGKHYDDAAFDILKISGEEWTIIQNKLQRLETTNTIAYLGRTMNDVINNVVDDNWCIRTLEFDCVDENTKQVSLAQNSKVFHDFDIPLNPNVLYTIQDAASNLGLKLP